MNEFFRDEADPEGLPYTPLMIAAEYGHQHIISLLLRKGAQMEQKTWRRGGWTALHFASGNGHVQAVKSLLEAGADPTARTIPVFTGATTGNTPTSLAEERGHKNVVKLLVVATA